MVGLDDLRGLFQPMILSFYDSMILPLYSALVKPPPAVLHPALEPSVQ